MRGEYDQAASQLQKVSIPFPNARRIRVATYAYLGRKEEAAADVAELLTIDPTLTLANLRESLPYKNRADLDREINGLQLAGVPEDAAEAIPQGPRIAVLPFANLSGDPEQEYFSDGMTEEIITELARFRDLFVMARQSTAQYKGQDVGVAEIAVDLGVDYVVEGSVRRGGDTVRITAQLIDTATGAHLWAETYDRDLTTENLFAIQDDIAAQVVANIGGLRGAIAQTRLGETRRGLPTRLDAYECVLLATEFRIVYSPATHLGARDCLERAVQLDPGYAEAWAALSGIYEQQVRAGFNETDEYDALERASEAANKALELDPANQRGRESLAFVHFSRRELDRFRAEAERAIAVNPNNALTIIELGTNIAWSGDWDRGLAFVRKGMALNPNHPPWINFPIALYYYHQREYERALALVRDINMPNIWYTHLHIATSSAQLGRTEEALAAANRIREIYPGFDLVIAEKELSKWNVPDHEMEHMIDGLRKAGIPEGDAAAN